MDPKLREEAAKDGAPEQDDQQFEISDEAAPKEQETIDIDETESAEKEFKTLDNKAFAAMRVKQKEAEKRAAELEAKVKEFEKRAAAPAASAAPQYQPAPNPQREVINGVPVPQTDAEWDQLARANWKVAVDLRSIVNARRVNQEAAQANKHVSTLEATKNKVLERHPELNDVSTEKSQIYLKILEQNPHYLTMPHGPIYAMRDMEEILGETSRPQNLDAQREATRASRAALTGAGKFTEKSARTVTLTKDELEFCNNNGLSPADFAKKKLEQEQARKGAQL